MLGQSFAVIALEALQLGSESFLRRRFARSAGIGNDDRLDLFGDGKSFEIRTKMRSGSIREDGDASARASAVKDGELAIEGL